MRQWIKIVNTIEGRARLGKQLVVSIIKLKLQLESNKYGQTVF